MDLADALEHSIIAGCGLDVFAVEPLPADHRLWTLPNVLLTPHIAVRDAENIPERPFQLLFDNARRFAAGEPLRNVVDKLSGAEALWSGPQAALVTTGVRMGRCRGPQSSSIWPTHKGTCRPGCAANRPEVQAHIERSPEATPRSRHPRTEKRSCRGVLKKK